MCIRDRQTLNGLQLGVLLFLLAAGLTLIFGIMDLINLAHGSLYMMGAYFAATFTNWTESFFIGLLLTLPACMLFGMLLEIIALRKLYTRSHLDQVLATFGLIFFFNEFVFQTDISVSKINSFLLENDIEGGIDISANGKNLIMLAVTELNSPSNIEETLNLLGGLSE